MTKKIQATFLGPTFGAPVKFIKVNIFLNTLKKTFENYENLSNDKLLLKLIYKKLNKNLEFLDFFEFEKNHKKTIK